MNEQLAICDDLPTRICSIAGNFDDHPVTAPDAFYNYFVVIYSRTFKKSMDTARPRLSYTHTNSGIGVDNRRPDGFPHHRLRNLSRWRSCIGISGSFVVLQPKCLSGRRVGPRPDPQ